jgi:hypothetical protein
MARPFQGAGLMGLARFEGFRFDRAGTVKTCRHAGRQQGMAAKRS